MTIQDCTQFDLYMIEIGQWEIVEGQLRCTNAGYISSERIKQGYASWLKNNMELEITSKRDREKILEARREAQRLQLLRQHLAKPTAERVRQLLK